MVFPLKVCPFVKVKEKLTVTPADNRVALGTTTTNSVALSATIQFSDVGMDLLGQAWTSLIELEEVPALFESFDVDSR